MLHSKHRVSSVATVPLEIITNSGIVETSYDNGVAFILALSSTEVLPCLSLILHIYVYILFTKGLIWI